MPNPLCPVHIEGTAEIKVQTHFQTTGNSMNNILNVKLDGEEIQKVLGAALLAPDFDATEHGNGGLCKVTILIEPFTNSLLTVNCKSLAEFVDANT